jgi:CheY-like chemotaxis protein
VTPTDLQWDILEPAAGILCMRGGAKESVEITTDCPPDLIVSTDQLRLKQIVLNLAVNSTKYVSRGFIRLRAENLNGSVVLFVEDSGPGLPPDKQDDVFRHVQESYDLMSQGTGIGLYVSQHLCGLMGASISLDKTYDSGIEGCPGARFIIDLQRPPMKIESSTGTSSSKGGSHIQKDEVEVAMDDPEEVPRNLNALFVDDDMIVRKLFVRSVRRACPSWNVEQASNGEAALQMVDNGKYDIIFVDQYMPGIERPLLGTETIQLMRMKGVQSVICGCSANDIESEFLQHGANAFVIKPFPCEKESLQKELRRVLQSRNCNLKAQNLHRLDRSNSYIEAAMSA